MNPLSLTQKYTKAHYHRGLIQSQLGNYEQAVINYNKAVELDPDFAPVYYERGTAHHHLGQDDLAIKDFEYYLELASEADNKQVVRETIDQLRAGQSPESVTNGA